MTEPRTTALVFCGGGPVLTEIPVLERPIVIAADSGAEEARRLGLHVDILVGDLDSVTPAVVAAIEAEGGEVERHPADKDATDLALALDRALGEGATHVVVAGGDGGRLDHLLGNALLLAEPRYAGCTIDAVLGAARLHVIRGDRLLVGEPGELISLFALGGPAHGVTTTGLRWALAGAELWPGSSTGISNEFTALHASVEVAEGVLLAVRPGVEAP